MDNKETGNGTFTSIINPESALEIKKSVFIFVSYVPCLSEEFKRIFHYTSIHVIIKGNNTLHGLTNAPLGQSSIIFREKCSIQMVLFWGNHNQFYIGKQNPVDG